MLKYVCLLTLFYFHNSDYNRGFCHCGKDLRARFRKKWQEAKVWGCILCVRMKQVLSLSHELFQLPGVGIDHMLLESTQVVPFWRATVTRSSIFIPHNYFNYLKFSSEQECVESAYSWHEIHGLLTLASEGIAVWEAVRREWAAVFDRQWTAWELLATVAAWLN